MSRVVRQWVALTPENYLRALRGYRWAVLVLVLLGGAGAGLASILQTPVYRASVQLLFSPNFPTADITKLNDGGNYILQRTVSYAQIADSPEIASEVIGRLGLPYTPGHLMADITVTTKADTAVLEIGVVDPEPGRARDIANAIADAFPGFLDRIEKPTGAVASPVKVSVVRRAVTPSAPDSPHTLTNTGLGLAGGLAVGAAAAVVRYARERTVRDAGHAAAIVDAALIGVVTAAPEPARGGDDPTGSPAEDLRQLRTNVRLRAADRPLGSIAVIGSVPGEGRTGVAADLAIAFARAGETVVLVDGDLRNPGIDRTFAIPNATGLTTVLRKEASFNDVTRRWRPDLPLYLLPTGPLAGEPGEKLLRSAELAKMLESFRSGCVLVIIDSPPLLSDAEAVLLAGATDATVMVARVGHTPADQLAAAVEVLRTKGTNLLGVVATR
ncbi:MAG: tyrosine-protein kinase [Micromonosporaceae bacterium]